MQAQPPLYALSFSTALSFELREQKRRAGKHPPQGRQQGQLEEGSGGPQHVSERCSQGVDDNQSL